MLNRKERRAAAHAQRKADRKAGFPIPQPQEPSAVAEPVRAEPVLQDIPEPGAPFPSLKSISPEQLAANKANAQHSTGATSQAGRQASSQNHTIHGLARHDASNFKVLLTEDPCAFEDLQKALIDEHQPATETEMILVNIMAESHWLTHRAQRLLNACIDPSTGAVTDDKKFSLYLRYQTTHKRAFHKSLNDLLRLRSEKRKTEIGFEAQNIAKEKHAMKKQTHYWDVLKKDAEACHQISLNTLQNIKARAENPGFEAEYASELAKRGVKPTNCNAAAA